MYIKRENAKCIDKIIKDLFIFKIANPGPATITPFQLYKITWGGHLTGSVGTPLTLVFGVMSS